MLFVHQVEIRRYCPRLYVTYRRRPNRVLERYIGGRAQLASDFLVPSRLTALPRACGTVVPASGRAWRAQHPGIDHLLWYPASGTGMVGGGLSILPTAARSKAHGTEARARDRLGDEVMTCEWPMAQVDRARDETLILNLGS